MNLLELAESYVSFHVLAPSSELAYRARARNFVNTLKINPDIHDITEEMGIQFRKALLSRSGPVNFNTNMRHLKVLLRYAVERGWLVKSPFAKVPKAPEPKLKPKTISLEHFDKAMAWLERLPVEDTPEWVGSPILWKNFLLTLMHTGMRLRQIQSLKWSDINFASQTILLRSETSKNRREWSIPMHPSVSDNLQILRAYAKQHFGATLHSVIFSGKFLCDRNRTTRVQSSLSYGQIRRFFENISLLFGSHIRCHKIRHTAGTELMRLTDNPKLVQEILGHTTIVTTMIYVHPSMDDMRQLINQR